MSIRFEKFEDTPNDQSLDAKINVRIKEIKQKPFLKEVAYQKLVNDEAFKSVATDSTDEIQYFGYFLDWDMIDLHAFATRKTGAFVERDKIRLIPRKNFTSLLEGTMPLKGLI